MAEPSEAQKMAGNYKKDHIRWYGLSLAIENRKGTTRSGSDKDGEPWEVTIPSDYGYIKKSEGADGDHVDCYIGGTNPRVYIINQCDADSGDWDEHKCMLGYKSREAAVRDYHKAFSDGRAGDRIDSIVPMSADEFKEWVKGDTTRPAVLKKAGGGTVLSEPEGGVVVETEPPAEVNPFDLQGPKKKTTQELGRLDIPHSEVNPFDAQRPPPAETGAPAKVRAKVGAASSKDRLAAIRQVYPDARPHGDDNFVFTDPRTGKDTLYNPTGLDYGDFPSLLPEIGEVAGGTLGAVGATLLRGRPSLAKNLVRTPAATGTGAMLGEEGVRRGVDAAMGTPDTRTAGETASDMATTAGINAAGAGAGELAVRGAGALLKKATPQRIGQTFDQYGVDLRTADDLAPQAEATARMLRPSGEGMTEREAGSALKRGVDDYASRVRNKGRQLYGEMDRYIPPDFETKMGETHKMLTGQRDEMVGARNIEAALGNPKARKMWEGLLDDLREAAASSGLPNGVPIMQLLQQQGLPFQAVRKWRSIVGEKLTDPDLVVDMPRGMLKDLYGSLTRDLEGAANAADGVKPGARAAFDRANNYWKSQMEVMDHYLNDIARKDLHTQAYRTAVQNPERLTALRAAVPPEEWDIVAAYTFRDLGQPARQAVQGSEGDLLHGATEMNTWNPTEFLKNWRSLGNEGRQALFGGTRYQHIAPYMDDMVNMSKAIDSKEFQSWAPQAQTLMQTMFSWPTLGADVAAANFAHWGMHAGPAGVAAAAIAPSAIRGLAWGMPRLWSSPGFLKFISKAPEFAGDNKAFASYLGQLPAAIEKEDPEVQKAALNLIRYVKGAGQ